ncbi:MAG: tRNA (adenosine(37)-N6)-threonylcarbamoyltransferase complex dimerization subunit type 1 TsaB [Bacilli bacterium]|nr:tRNA (adenosine(37)-N6)-threonylcarbamoyltransferase complex dimerization subunit type 1 TsaB [Bacilli bacterium]MBR1818327.1 tRNA (adenosine(37)-N6)-threonylcarbamoyltransferase complex dimerization subunit type 1 TsaB [Bacilli bacterium]
MDTLYIDTHDTSVVLALYKDEILVSKKEIENSRAHSEITIPTLVSLLEENHITIHDISDIIVVNGPGSFTGERLGVTIAKTLAYTLNIPIRVITSLERYLNEELLKDNDYLSLKEKNGYYIAKIENEMLQDYRYLKKSEYEEFTKQNNVIEPTKIDYEKLCAYAHQKKSLNPHEVNPFYVKTIEVEK